MSWRVFFVLCLGLATTGSAIAVVWYQHQTRLLFKQLTRLEDTRDKLNNEWRQLQLEMGTSAAHARVEQIAREQLDMIHPANTDIRSLRL